MKGAGQRLHSVKPAEDGNRREFIRGLLGAALAPLLPRAMVGARKKEQLQLEVVVSCLEDAVAAHQGGATRFEVAVRLDKGGLSPPLDLVQQIVQSVPVPARIMLRENEGLELASVEELETMKNKARALARLKVDGIVLGWIKNGRLDLEAIQQILPLVPGMRFTVHNAIERTSDPLEALRALQAIPNVDRVLVSGARATLAERTERLQAYERLLGSKPIIVVSNLKMDFLKPIQMATRIREFHMGNMVRTPEEPFPVGKVDAQKVKRAREILLGGE